MSSQLELDDGSQVTITLDGMKGDVEAGGHGHQGDLILKDAGSAERIRLGHVVETGGPVLGPKSNVPQGPTVTKDYTGIRLRDHSGADLVELGQIGASITQSPVAGPVPVLLRVGGGGAKGEVELRDTSGNVTARIDGEGGATIKIESKAHPAGRFMIENAGNTQPALQASTSGGGVAVSASASGSGDGIRAVTSSEYSSASVGTNKALGCEGALGTYLVEEFEDEEWIDPAGVSGTGYYGVIANGDFIGLQATAGGALVSKVVEGLTVPTGIGVWARGSAEGIVAICDKMYDGDLWGGERAGDFLGHVMVDGDLAVIGTKYFVIDHPLDPEHKALVHASVESAERLNVYSGTVDIDADGRASVRLPEWFTPLNGNVRYQLTPVGAPAPSLHIEREVDDSGAFTIGGGPARGKVSWLLAGERRDSYAQAHPMQVEVEKAKAEHGTYLHPVEHGAGPEKGLGYRTMHRLEDRSIRYPSVTRTSANR